MWSLFLVFLKVESCVGVCHVVKDSGSRVVFFEAELERQSGDVLGDEGRRIFREFWQVGREVRWVCSCWRRVGLCFVWGWV